MSAAVALITLVLLAAVVAIISHPLQRARRAGLGHDERADLDAAREAKLREIHDAELDHATGKLSDADHAAIDSTLRAEAADILRRLDDLQAASI